MRSAIQKTSEIIDSAKLELRINAQSRHMKVDVPYHRIQALLEPSGIRVRLFPVAAAKPAEDFIYFADVDNLGSVERLYGVPLSGAIEVVESFDNEK